MRRALTIGGLDPSAGAGIETDVKVGEVFNVHFHPIVTMITFQTTSMFAGGTCVNKEVLLAQMENYLEKVDTWKVGALCNEAIADTLANLVDEFRSKVVLDPVLEASAGGKLYTGRLNSLLELLKRSYAVTPNIKEVERILGIKIRSIEDIRWSAEELQKLGPELVIITGGHFGTDEEYIIDYVRWNGKELIMKGKRIPINIHGSGSILAASLTSLLASGKDPITSARYSIGYTRVVHRFVKSLDGGYVGDVLTSFRLAYYRFECHEEYRAFIKWLESLPFEKAKKIAPEVGLNVACSIPKEVSRGVSTVIGVPGRLHLTPRGLRKCDCPWWGGSNHLARLLVNAMKYSDYKVAINIKYSEENVQRLREMGLKVVEIDRSLQQRGMKTMKWLVEYVYNKYNEIPQVIYDRGFYGKEAMIRIFAKDLTQLRTILNGLIGD
ncbi:hypothetical protein EYM_07800 [Ignicoccus islandicus DSM 13165]|uniref:Uncharacterized protein n=1 Tax=Ignicoccus islandicus DSM 13165 TaxID=940295 RepID=A0A0U2U9Y0_9CREN|nr:PfkB family carbohydrate kinase [Ignicoccus islandicus]ALU12820.1 hypothetical protein EYM_07800 [Ignicoccus islandicus DSM 13165]